jgi:hypothetical protein
VLRNAIDRGDSEAINEILDPPEGPPVDLDLVPVDLLNKLLVRPGHRFHQLAARALQRTGDGSTVPYVRAVLDRGFDFLAYTGSDDVVIAKWLSWLLSDIGTPDAVAALHEYADSPNEEIAEAMRYRLARRAERGSDC